MTSSSLFVLPVALPLPFRPSWAENSLTVRVWQRSRTPVRVFRCAHAWQPGTDVGLAREFLAFYCLLTVDLVIYT